MKISRVLLVLCLISCSAVALSFDLPAGWFKAGSHPNSYEMGVDKGAGHNGKNAATIRSIDAKIDGFGTLMQNSTPTDYLGKRVRMTAFVKTKDLSEWAGIWFRIDQKNSTPLGFDNMLNGKTDRSIKGTTDWKKYDIVLNVPPNASNIAYGALLVGTGQLWFDNVAFKVVGKQVPTTGADQQAYPNQEHARDKPSNLDFEK